MAASNMDSGRQGKESLPRLVTDQHFRIGAIDKANLIKTEHGWQTTLTLDEYIWKYIEHFNKASLESRFSVCIQAVNDSESVHVNVAGQDKSIVSLAEEDIILLHNSMLTKCGITLIHCEDFPRIAFDMLKNICTSFPECLHFGTGGGTYAIVGPKQEIHKVAQKLIKGLQKQHMHHAHDLRSKEISNMEGEGRYKNPTQDRHHQDSDVDEANLNKTENGWQTTLTLDENVWKYIQHFHIGSIDQHLHAIQSVNDGDNVLVTLMGVVKEKVSLARQKILKLHNKAVAECGINQVNSKVFPGMTDSMMKKLSASFEECLLIDSGRGKYAIIGPKQTIHVFTQELKKTIRDQDRHLPPGMGQRRDPTPGTRTELGTSTAGVTFGESKTLNTDHPDDRVFNTGYSGSVNTLPSNELAGNEDNSPPTKPESLPPIGKLKVLVHEENIRTENPMALPDESGSDALNVSRSARTTQVFMRAPEHTTAHQLTTRTESNLSYTANARHTQDTKNGADQGIGEKTYHGGTPCATGTSNDHSITETTATADIETSEPEASLSDQCPVCMELVRSPKKLSCGHIFCEKCISAWFSDKPVCPVCGRAHGVITGNQPEGEMRERYVRNRLPGFEDSAGSIIIDYEFPPGTQQACHPNPGRPYEGIRRQAYLPDNTGGREVLALLRKAFHAKLTFTIGRSVTTGLDDQITWNDIHHKTATHGGPTNYGYPDENYLSKVKEELAAKGIR